MIASGGLNGSIRIWQAPISGAVVQRFQAHGLCGEDVSFSPDEHYLASTSDDASVRLWSLRKPPGTKK